MMTNSKAKGLLATGMICFALAGTASAANVALSGTATVGIFFPGDDLNTLGTPYAHAPDSATGLAPTVNDGIIANDNRVDTWGNQATTGQANAQTHAYVSISWAAPLAETVTSVGLNIRTFGDGGWFGVNGVVNNPLMTGGAITAETEPGVQITLDGGTTWTDVGSSNDYLSVVNGVAANTVSGTSTFTLDSPVSGINGIRLIGTVGGAAGGLTNGSGNGFLGVGEFSVEGSIIPEPSGLALIGLAGIGFILRRRR